MVADEAGEAHIMKYQVIERGTDKVIGTYASRKRAQSKRDAMDNAWGGYHYYIKEIAE